MLCGVADSNCALYHVKVVFWPNKLTPQTPILFTPRCTGTISVPHGVCTLGGNRTHIFSSIYDYSFRKRIRLREYLFAHPQGFEPWRTVLETVMLPLHHECILLNKFNRMPLASRRTLLIRVSMAH